MGYIQKMCTKPLVTPLSIILAAALASTSATATAEGLTAWAYLGLPFDAGKPFYGLRGDVDRPSSPLAATTPLLGETAYLDLRFGGTESVNLSIKGVALDSVLGRYYATDDEAAGGPAKPGDEFDWYHVAGILVGVGLVAAVIAADDARIEVCSGPNCPPEEKPKPETAEAEKDRMRGAE